MHNLASVALTAFWLFLFVLECNLSVLATTQPHAESETAKSIQATIKASWSSSTVAKPDKSTDVWFGVADDGRIYEPVVRAFSDNDQYDAECVEAVCSMSPIAPAPDVHSGYLHHFNLKFGAGSTLVPKFDGKDVKNYLLKNPEPKEISFGSGRIPFVVVHKIPLIVLQRYPGMFTEEELRDSDNLVKIISPPLANKCADLQPTYVRQIAALYASWNGIFSQDRVTKAKIYEWAKQIPAVLD